MAADDVAQPFQDVVERNSLRIERLIREVEKLVDLLERQRIVDPMVYHDLKQELREIQQDA